MSVKEPWGARHSRGVTGLAFFRVVASITNLSTYWSLSRHKGTKKSDVAHLAPCGVP